MVTVCIAHHMPMKMFGYSLWSSSRISSPLPTTITAVDVTMMLAALRTVTGLRRNRASCRSIGLTRATLGLFPEQAAAVRERR